MRLDADEGQPLANARWAPPTRFRAPVVDPLYSDIAVTRTVLRIELERLLLMALPYWRYR